MSRRWSSSSCVRGSTLPLLAAASVPASSSALIWLRVISTSEPSPMRVGTCASTYVTSAASRLRPARRPLPGSSRSQTAAKRLSNDCRWPKSYPGPASGDNSSREDCTGIDATALDGKGAEARDETADEGAPELAAGAHEAQRPRYRDAEYDRVEVAGMIADQQCRSAPRHLAQAEEPGAPVDVHGAAQDDSRERVERRITRNSQREARHQSLPRSPAGRVSRARWRASRRRRRRA